MKYLREKKVKWHTWFVNSYVMENGNLVTIILE